MKVSILGKAQQDRRGKRQPPAKTNRERGRSEFHGFQPSAFETLAVD